MKVLIAVDGSPGSFEAVRQACRLLAPGKDELAFYYAPPVVRMDGGRDAVERARAALAKTIFAEARTHLSEAWQSSVHEIIDDHDARDGIHLAAEQWKAEMIVVGARGLGMLERLLLGSVSRSIAHSAKLPVLVARPPKHHWDENSYRVLLATEGPECGAAELLGKFSWPSEATGRTISVIRSPLTGRLPDWLEKQARGPEVESLIKTWVREHDEEIANVRQRMLDYRGQLPAPFDAAQPLVAEGDPASEILAEIHRDAVDLAVVCTRGGGGFARWIVGSTSEAVLNHAPCSVLITRQPAGKA